MSRNDNCVIRLQTCEYYIEIFFKPSYSTRNTYIYIYIYIYIYSEITKAHAFVLFDLLAIETLGPINFKRLKFLSVLVELFN